jgi:hypothetical protein
MAIGVLLVCFPPHLMSMCSQVYMQMALRVQGQLLLQSVWGRFSRAVKSILTCKIYLCQVFYVPAIVNYVHEISCLVPTFDREGNTPVIKDIPNEYTV